MLDAQGHATLICELENCGHTYNVRLLTVKERCKMVAIRALIVIVILITAGLMAGLGSWIGEITNDSDGLRIVGDILVGAGVVIDLLVVVWTLMSFWFWPDRYDLTYVEPPVTAENESLRTSSLALSGSPDVRQAHSVRLRRAPR
jgi:hypothetical protein